MTEKKKHFLDDGDKIFPEFAELMWDLETRTLIYAGCSGNILNANGYILEWDDDEQNYYWEE